MTSMNVFQRTFGVGQGAISLKAIYNFKPLATQEVGFIVKVGKLGLIIVAGFCEGLLMGGVVKELLGRDHQFVLISIVGIMGILLLFAFAVQLQKQRISFYAGGMIASFGLLNYLQKTLPAFPLDQLTVIGLMYFAAYTCFCCQVWISLFQNGERDFVGQAFYLPFELPLFLLRLIAVLILPNRYKRQQIQQQKESVQKKKK
eukprot:TRINITY_DN3032_c0_g2_i7.p2 TRINITY_DN3032_c0_g2~~TRINITY_DN3032_c0_g2_i7.p2  ORF type:complete len:202 (-),score=15.97 TRINITY_DN3032_c0_g2_i7:242-847(-)